MRWGSFLQQLRDIEKMLGRPYMREQFISKCVRKDSADEVVFRSWSTRLQGLRWEVVVKFCEEVTCLMTCDSCQVKPRNYI